MSHLAHLSPPSQPDSLCSISMPSMRTRRLSGGRTESHKIPGGGSAEYSVFGDSAAFLDAASQSLKSTDSGLPLMWSRLWRDVGNASFGTTRKKMGSIWVWSVWFWAQLANFAQQGHRVFFLASSEAGLSARQGRDKLRASRKDMKRE